VTVGKLGMWKVCNVVWVWFAAVLRCIGECGQCGGCEYVLLLALVGITPCSVGRACFSWHASEGIVAS
jgi:hypothetical protein